MTDTPDSDLVLGTTRTLFLVLMKLVVSSSAVNVLRSCATSILADSATLIQPEFRSPIHSTTTLHSRTALHHVGIRQRLNIFITLTRFRVLIVPLGRLPLIEYPPRITPHILVRLCMLPYEVSLAPAPNHTLLGPHTLTRVRRSSAL